MPIIVNGTTGDDSLRGTDAADTFRLAGGGDDTAFGAGGRDVFLMGGSLTGDDRIDGEDAYDVVVLNGDYSSGLSLQTETLSGIEELRLSAGHDYDISGVFLP